MWRVNFAGCRLCDWSRRCNPYFTAIRRGKALGERLVSTALIKQEIHRFLSTADPEVVCISGKWGVGKTFAWNRYLKELASTTALKRYSYVSLFGVNSLEQLKFSIFENTVATMAADLQPSIETLKTNARDTAARFGRKAMWFLQELPFVKDYVGGLGPLWFLSVTETIVCIDDVERRGNDLSIREVLGLVSSLKEHKKCKVVLILNDDALKQDKREFRTYFEKTIDVALTFEPSAAECARIALDHTIPFNKQLADYCITLGISNIRVIKKIERAVGKLHPLLSDLALSRCWFGRMGC